MLSNRRRSTGRESQQLSFDDLLVSGSVDDDEVSRPLRRDGSEAHATVAADRLRLDPRAGTGELFPGAERGGGRGDPRARTLFDATGQTGPGRPSGVRSPVAHVAPDGRGGGLGRDGAAGAGTGPVGRGGRTGEGLHRRLPGSGLALPSPGAQRRRMAGPPGGDGLEASAPTPPAARPEPGRAGGLDGPAGEWRARSAEDLAPAGQAHRLAANLEALRVLRRLEQARQPATT